MTTVEISHDSALIIEEIFEHILSSSAKDLSHPVVDAMRKAVDEIKPQLDEGAI